MGEICFSGGINYHLRSSRASARSLLALLLRPSDCLSERTSMDGLLEFSSTNVLQAVYTMAAAELTSGSGCFRSLLTV